MCRLKAGRLEGGRLEGGRLEGGRLESWNTRKAGDWKAGGLEDRLERERVGHYTFKLPDVDKSFYTTSVLDTWPGMLRNMKDIPSMPQDPKKDLPSMLGADPPTFLRWAFVQLCNVKPVCNTSSQCLKSCFSLLGCPYGPISAKDRCVHSPNMPSPKMPSWRAPT